MEYVHVISGKYSQGRDKFREIHKVCFPLVSGEIQSNEYGKFIVVDGVPVRGYPKRDFKVFVDDETCFQVVDEATAEQLTLERSQNAPYVRTPTTVSEPDAPMVIETNLHGPDDNQIKERIRGQFFTLKQLAWDIAAGEINGLIVIGPPGVGKTTEIMQALESDGDSRDIMAKLIDPTAESVDPDAPVVSVPPPKPKIRWGKVGGSITDAALYELLWEYKDKNDVLFLDDVNVFHSEKGLDYLKHATSDDPVRKIHRRRSVNAVRVMDDIPDSFVFQGRIIFASNKDFEDLSQFPAAVREHVKALADRVYYLDMTMHTMREKFLRIEDVCIDQGVLKSMGLDDDAVIEVFAFFKEHLNKFRSISIRTVQKIAKMKILYQEDWRRMAATTTMRTSELSKMNLS